MPSKEPFEIAVPEATLTDLKDRLGRTRFPRDFGNAGWEYGTNLDYLKELVEYWRTKYDWRRHEHEMNSFANYETTIDGIPIHFIHEPGKGPNPIPLIMTHGWPWWRPQGFIRRRRAFTAGLWLFDAVDHHRNQLLEHRRSLGEVDAGRAGATKSSRPRAATGARSLPRNWAISMPTASSGSTYTCSFRWASSPAVVRRPRTSVRARRAGSSATATFSITKPATCGFNAPSRRPSRMRSTIRRPDWRHGSSRSAAPGAIVAVMSKSALARMISARPAPFTG